MAHDEKVAALSAFNALLSYGSRAHHLNGLQSPDGTLFRFDDRAAFFLSDIDRDTIRAAITAFQAEAWQPMVKPLQWREEEPDWWAAAALSWPSGYEAWMTPRGVVRLRMPGESKFSLFEGTLDEAKRAAEHDYESRIRLCLLPNPPASP